MNPETKTYYVIRSTAGWYMREKPALGKSTLATAQRFGTATQALTALVFAKTSDENVPWAPKLVRVEETTGTATRRVLGETEQAKEGEVVKYVLAGDCEDYAKDLTRPIRDGASRWAMTLDDAKLFASTRDVIAHIQANTQITGMSTYTFDIKRVVIETTAPTITETVLQ